MFSYLDRFDALKLSKIHSKGTPGKPIEELKEEVKNCEEPNFIETRGSDIDECAICLSDKSDLVLECTH